VKINKSSGGLVPRTSFSPLCRELICPSIPRRRSTLGDEQAPVLTPDVTQKGKLDADRVVWGSGPDFQFQSSEDIQGVYLLSTWVLCGAEPYRSSSMRSLWWKCPVW
jgi:hypothetical protein